MIQKHLKLIPAALLFAAPAVWAAVPASGDLTDTALSLQWDGSGPYVVPNPSSDAGDPVCMPPLPICDEFTLNVSIPEEFRVLPENQRETVRIGISFPTTLPTVDYDIFVYAPSGTLIGEGTGSFGVQEAITVPLKTLKDGAYRILVEPYTPFGTNYAGVVEVGKQAKSAYSLAPQAGRAPLRVTFDARGLSSANAGGYRFDFGDGSEPVTDADGVIEHTYVQDGEYLSRVQTGDSSGAKGFVSAAQTVFVGDIAAADKSGASQFGGAFGWSALLVLAGLGASRGRRRA